MKHTAWYIILAFLIFEGSALTATKNDAAQAVTNAEVLSRNLEMNKELGVYIPYDTYGAALLDTAQARNLINDRKYDEAYFYASKAAIRFETATITGQARMTRQQAVKLLSKRCSSGADTNALTGAKFFKKGDVYKTTLFDWQLFVKRNNQTFYRLNSEGKDRLNKILSVIQSYPGCKLKIVGHMEKHDYKESSKHKADIIAKYLIEKKIEPDRIEIIGLGNKEVMETDRGYRRVNRMEFIITGLQ